MTWIEAIKEALKFILAELLAPIFDWLADALGDGLFWFGILFFLGLIAAVLVFVFV